MARQVKVPSYWMTLLSVHVFMFTYLFPCKIGTNVCVEIWEEEIVDISGMPKFFFFERLTTISTRGFSISYFSNPSDGNLK
jgi:hypothetical protein